MPFLFFLPDLPLKINNKFLTFLPAHFIHEIKTIAYDVSDVNLFPPHLNEIPLQKRGVTGAPYTTTLVPLVPLVNCKYS